MNKKEITTKETRKSLRNTKNRIKIRFGNIIVNIENRIKIRFGNINMNTDNVKSSRNNLKRQ